MMVYLDDILIFTKILKEHHNIINQMLIILKKNKLIL